MLSPPVDTMKLAFPVLTGRSLETTMGNDLENEADSMTHRGDIAGSLVAPLFVKSPFFEIQLT